MVKKTFFFAKQNVRSLNCFIFIIIAIVDIKRFFPLQEHI